MLAQAPAPWRAPGFNALSTISSCTMENLLHDQGDNMSLLDTRLFDTRASFGDILATPSSPWHCGQTPQQQSGTLASEKGPQVRCREYVWTFWGGCSWSTEVFVGSCFNWTLLGRSEHSCQKI